MTRKDYELVAQSLAQAYNESKNTPVIGVTVAVIQFLATLSADNPAFNRLQLVDSIQALVVNPRAFDQLSELRNAELSNMEEVVVF